LQFYAAEDVVEVITRVRRGFVGKARVVAAAGERIAVVAARAISRA
jgi:hypothetical protein